VHIKPWMFETIHAWNSSQKLLLNRYYTSPPPFPNYKCIPKIECINMNHQQLGNLQTYILLQRLSRKVYTTLQSIVKHRKFQQVKDECLLFCNLKLIVHLTHTFFPLGAFGFRSSWEYNEMKCKHGQALGAYDKGENL
jgi:hypothetical protein